MCKKKLFIIILFTSVLSFGQIVNIESLRKPTDTSRFVGSVKFDVDLTKNVNTFFSLRNEITLQYTSGKNLFLFLNNIVFTEINTNKFTDKSIQHLRYNYQFNTRTTFEIFTQFQRDKVSFINLRALFGLGTRFQLFLSKKNNAFLGTLIMYEHENSVGNINDVIDKATRGNIYFSFRLNLKNNLFLSSVTYYQPKLNNFSDFRVSSETSFSFELIKNLALVTSFSYQLDKFPVLGIPNSQYSLLNGIQYTF